jgi:ribosomal protein L40E
LASPRKYIPGTDILAEGGSASSTSVVFELVDSTAVEALYKTQFLFVVKNIDGQVVNDTWYDAGTEITFVPPQSVPNSVQMDGFLGVLGANWKLQGWTDNGNATFQTPLLMNSAHTISPIYSADYWVPTIIAALLLAILSVLVIFLLMRRRRTAGIKQVQAATQIQASSKNKADMTITPTKFCRECGAKIPRDSVFCEECGKQLT